MRGFSSGVIISAIYQHTQPLSDTALSTKTPTHTQRPTQRQRPLTTPMLLLRRSTRGSGRWQQTEVWVTSTSVLHRPAVDIHDWSISPIIHCKSHQFRITAPQLQMSFIVCVCNIFFQHILVTLSLPSLPWRRHRKWFIMVWPSWCITLLGGVGSFVLFSGWFRVYQLLCVL